MKGYSFDELVKLAMAAVKRAGDNMTGNLTTPKVLVSEAQGTESNALTRKDYVDTQLSGKLSTSGGTITGPLRVEANPGAAKLIFADDTGSDLAILHDDSYTAFREGEQGVDLLALTGGETPAVAMRNPRAALAQEQMPQSLTRKDYVDTYFVAKAGGETSGTIYCTVAAGQSNYFAAFSGKTTGGPFVETWRRRGVFHADAVHQGSSFAPVLSTYFLDTEGWEGQWLQGVLGGVGASADSWAIHYQDGSGPGGNDATFVFGNNGTLGLPAWPTASQHATRKDYVDGQVATRAPTTHTHTVAAITDLKPQDVWAAANTLAVRDEVADIYARLLRTTYQDQSDMGGAIAFRINNSNNNYTRYCSNPAAVREWMRYAKTGWDMSWRAYIEDPAYPMTEYHIPGSAAVITYLASDGNYRISSSNGAGVAAAERMRLDPHGNLYAAGGVHDMGQRVYSPHNQPHYSHNHTAAQGNADIVASGWGQVGTYMMAAVIPGHAAAMNPSDTIAGSSLRPANCSEWGQNRSWALPGTWKCLGFVSDNNDDRWDDHTTLWIRIA